MKQRPPEERPIRWIWSRSGPRRRGVLLLSFFALWQAANALLLPLVFRFLIDGVVSGNRPLFLSCIGIYCLLFFLQTALGTLSFHICQRTIFQMETSIRSHLFQGLLHTEYASLSQHSLGELQNHLNDDVSIAVNAIVNIPPVLLSLVGIRVVVVHGGGPEISGMLKKVGKESTFVDGLRYTDEETMEIVQQVLCGQVNKDLVATLNRMGGRALGLCGLDGGMFQAKKLDEKYGLVGEIRHVDPRPVTDALAGGYVPVVSTVAQGLDAEVSYNVNADTAAAKLAVALGAEKLILLTDVRGLLRDPKDENTLISELQLSSVPALVREGIITGGMIPKVDCCVEAVRSGVKSATILDGRVEHSILIELLSDAGIGTMLIQ